MQALPTQKENQLVRVIVTVIRKPVAAVALAAATTHIVRTMLDAMALARNGGTRIAYS